MATLGIKEDRCVGFEPNQRLLSYGLGTTKNYFEAEDRANPTHQKHSILVHSFIQ